MPTSQWMGPAPEWYKHEVGRTATAGLGLPPIAIPAPPPMKIPLTTTIVLAACLFGGVALRAADDEIDAATKAKIAQFDKGPATIDTAAYPKSIQQDYNVFRQRCSLCHTLARPINSDFVLPGDWSRYVKRMMHKPGSEITPVSAKKIYTFLVYDTSVRKKTMLDAALAKLSAADRAAEEAKIKEVADQAK